MSEIWVLILLAAVIVLGGYLLSYRSGKPRVPREKNENKFSSKK